MRGVWITASLVLLSMIVSMIAGCGGDRYGYSRSYSSYGDEAPFLERSVELSYEEVRRFPDRHAEELIGWFGVVMDISDLDRTSGEGRLTLQYRRHQERHLCSDERSGSCRVTVSQRGIGPFQVLLTVRPEDLQEGTDRLWTGSLIKIYGHVTDAGSEESGPIIQVDHYRHFPHGRFVTTAAAGSMRQ